MGPRPVLSAAGVDAVGPLPHLKRKISALSRIPLRQPLPSADVPFPWLTPFGSANRSSPPDEGTCGKEKTPRLGRAFVVRPLRFPSQPSPPHPRMRVERVFFLAHRDTSLSPFFFILGKTSHGQKRAFHPFQASFEKKLPLPFERNDRFSDAVRCFFPSGIAVSDHLRTSLPHRRSIVTPSSLEVPVKRHGRPSPHKHSSSLPVSSLSLVDVTFPPRRCKSVFFSSKNIFFFPRFSLPWSSIS